RPARCAPAAARKGKRPLPAIKPSDSPATARLALGLVVAQGAAPLEHDAALGRAHEGDERAHLVRERAFRLDPPQGFGERHARSREPTERLLERGDAFGREAAPAQADEIEAEE